MHPFNLVPRASPRSTQGGGGGGGSGKMRDPVNEVGTHFIYVFNLIMARDSFFAGKFSLHP